MTKPLLGSLVVATLLLSDVSAATMYERFEAMEKEMQRLQSELAELKAEKAQAPISRGESDDEDEDEADDEDSEDGAKSSNYDEDDAEDEDDEDSIEDIVEELQEEVQDLTRATNGNHIKLGVDFRTSYDYISYKMASDTAVAYNNQLTPIGTKKVSKKQKNSALFSNRLWINMSWQATNNLSFTGQLAYNKTYGARGGNTGPFSTFNNFDWITNENPDGDSQVTVKSAYFFYKDIELAGLDIPWTFSVGRRPSTNGHLINMRDDDAASSPSGHTINVEFDGASAKFGLENVTGIEGMYIKFCAGQGGTNANERFSSTPYATNKDADAKDIWLGGFIFVPYDDGQYSIGTQFYGAANLIGQDVYRGGISGSSVTPGQLSNLTTVGDIYSGSIYGIVNGIGNEWSDFLDETTFFVSGAMSRTHPDKGKDGFGQQITMLGSTDMENGYSYWAGLQMPSLISEDGRFGVEFNHGSKYWRPITYAEDTLVGSKIAVRGDAYELYFTEPLVDDILSLQIRYTYIDYDYSGSNGFFGSGSGTPISIKDARAQGIGGAVVDTAQDLRIYLRYKY